MVTLNLSSQNPPQSPFFKGGSNFPLFGKEGLGEILR